MNLRPSGYELDEIVRGDSAGYAKFLVDAAFRPERDIGSRFTERDSTSFV